MRLALVPRTTEFYDLFTRAGQNLLETARLVEHAGGVALAVRADVSLAGDVERMVAEITGKLGPIDLLVNNAGVFDYVSHSGTTRAIWRHHDGPRRFARRGR